MTVRMVKRMVVGKDGVKVQDGWIADIRVRLPSKVMHRERVRAQGANRAACWCWTEARAAHIVRYGPEDGKEVSEEKRAPTVEAFAQKFLSHAGVNNKPSTAYGKRHTLENHLVPFFGAMRLDEVGGAQVEAFKSQQVKAGLSNKTVNNQLAVLGRLLSLAVEWGELKAAPKMHALKVAEPPIVFLDFAEAEAFLAAAEPEWHPMLSIAIWTGLRQGELRGLQWADVDLANARLFVRRSLWRGIEGLPKGGKAREVGLCTGAVEALRAQQLKTALRRRYVFSPDAGEAAFTEKAIEKVVHETCRRAGLEKDLSWHGLRHTFGSQLAMLGARPGAIQRLMGHAKLAMTEKYMHLAPAVLEGTTALFNRPAECGAIRGQSAEPAKKEM